MRENIWENHRNKIIFCKKRRQERTREKHYVISWVNYS